MRSFSRSALFFAFLSPALAQNCYFTPDNTTNCPTNGSQNPDIKGFAVQVVSAFQTMYGQMLGLPQPKIPIGAELTPLSAVWTNSETVGCFGPPNVCKFTSNTLAQQFIQSVWFDQNAGGAQVMGYADWNPSPTPFTQAAEYTGSAVPPNTHFWGQVLAVYDYAAQYLTSNGIKIRLAPAPDSTVWTACGIADPSTMSVTTMTNCLNPMYAAMVAHWHNLSPPVAITDFAPQHEPLALWQIQTGQVFTTAQWAAFLASSSPVITSASGGSGINIGSGFTGGENSYVTYNLAHVSNTLWNYVGVDAYAKPQVYATTMLNVYANYCAEAIAAGFACKADESAIPRHCDESGACSESNAYEGCGWQTWQLYGLKDEWYRMITRWASAMGFSYWTYFAPWPQAWLTTDSTNANCEDTTPGGYTQTVMTNLGSTTLSGTSYRLAGQWQNVAIQGQVKLGGHITIQ